MNKYSLVTLLVVASITSHIQADKNAVHGVAIEDHPGLGVSVQDGLTVDVGLLGVGFREESSDEANYQKIKNNSNRKKYTGPCDCEDIKRTMKRLEKNKDTTFILDLGIRNHQYKKLQQQHIDCGCAVTNAQ